MLTINVSIGGYLDRLAIGLVKTMKLADAGPREVSGGLVADLLRQLRERPPAGTLPCLGELLAVHAELWDLEDTIRELASALFADVAKDETSQVQYWLQSAMAADSQRQLLSRYLACSLRIRNLNDRRHSLVAQLDDSAKDVGEPKHYAVTHDQGVSDVLPDKQRQQGPATAAVG